MYDLDRLCKHLPLWNCPVSERAGRWCRQVCEACLLAVTHQDRHSHSVSALPGSGKSSALRLIFRFYDPTSGAVFMDGQNIADVTQVSHPRTHCHTAAGSSKLPCKHFIRRPHTKLSTGPCSDQCTYCLQCKPALASEDFRV